MSKKGGRPSAWKSPTKAIRVPEHLADHLLSLARQMEAGEAPTPLPAASKNPEKPLLEDLRDLVWRHSEAIDLKAPLIELLLNPPLKMPLYESHLTQQFRDIQLSIQGHETNTLCGGIFRHIRAADLDVVLFLLVRMLATAACSAPVQEFEPLPAVEEFDELTEEDKAAIALRTFKPKTDPATIAQGLAEGWIVPTTNEKAPR